MKITLNNAKQLEYFVNMALETLNIFKNDFDFNFEEILKTLESMPVQLRDRSNVYREKIKENWTLLLYEEVVNFYRTHIVRIQKFTENKFEEFGFYAFSLDPVDFKRFSFFFEYPIMKRKVQYNSITQQDEVYIGYYSGKSYLCFSQQKANEEKKIFRKEFNFEEVSSKLDKIYKRLKEKAKTPTQE